MPRQFHWALHYDAKNLCPYRTQCKCNRERDHPCKSSCKDRKTGVCQPRPDGGMPTTEAERDRLDFQMELNRHIPPIYEWGSSTPQFYCKTWCGARVHNQLLHFQFHVGTSLQERKFQETIISLFGEN